MNINDVDIVYHWLEDDRFWHEKYIPHIAHFHRIWKLWLADPDCSIYIGQVRGVAQNVICDLNQAGVLEAFQKKYGQSFQCLSKYEAHLQTFGKQDVSQF